MSSKLLGHVWDLDLPDSTTKLILLRLADNANDETGECFPSLAYLQDKCSIKSKTTIRLALTKLQELGFILVIKRKKESGINTSNLYKLNMEKILTKTKITKNSSVKSSGSETVPLDGSETVPLDGSESVPYGSETVPLDGSESVPRTNNSFEPIINQSISSSSEQVQTKSPKRKLEKFSNDDLTTAEWMFSQLQKLNPKIKYPNINRWANEVRLIREIDRRSHREICELFQWANRDGFWKSNILSPHKLREKWDQLEMKRQSQIQFGEVERKMSFTEKNAMQWNRPEDWEGVF
ncbi:helix-turn-helix domain-containing protein [Lonepinella koalarum]|uniref:Helix-turn-helix protein n=3 Tax=Lonepinella koalarum TaxID=53417 RepID=A0A4R1KXJ4_9PAST|nr:helix-turn-helix domain-containing protein [Lonepinella koalarum]MDH2927251.1 hypothetical protein [Lonepinella koalarum]MDH2927925.1 hypothetical protein [Lonepinella koalarum]TCK70122.1 helix-turn-helix protein [Lonepinella koalarum]